MTMPSDKPTSYQPIDPMQDSSLPTTTKSQDEAYYDIAIVGAGISSAHTLIHYLSLLEQQAFERPVRIVVTEKSGEFWTGIPYGVKSGCDSLLISSLKEFIPHQPEREQFISWLNENCYWIFASQKERDGELTSKWLEANAAAISQGMWDELFIPRHVYGLYLKHRVTTTIEEATAKGKIEIDLLTAEAIDIQCCDERYRVELGTTAEKRSSFVAIQLVLAIGSPPNMGFEFPQATDDSDICYIDNMYEPSMDVNIQRICRALQQSDRQTHRQVLMVGSNAGTLDALYCLNNSAAATSLIDKFIILSPNAAFPHRISREIASVDYSPTHLQALIATESFTAEQILLAVAQEVADATARKIEISDIYTQVSTAVIQALNLLDDAQQQQFVSKYAVEIGKLQRRAGGEYLDVVDRLIASDRLTFIKGKFHRYHSSATIDFGCEYISSESQLPTQIDAPIGVVINCAGFQDVTRSSSVLIQNSIERGICVPNDSRRGFRIDHNFEASKNCFIMGPLVAGNITGDFKVWHAESCQRIISLSKLLARVLAERVIPTAAASVTLDSPPVETPTTDTVGILVNV
jgi:uncharacterized NAD(P)/FAD-binding protein YdhS